MFKIVLASRENLSSGFPTKSDTNRAVQTKKMVRGLKFRILKVKRLYFLCSKKKGADQLHSHCAADLRLCFCICKKQVFSGCDSFELAFESNNSTAFQCMLK